jgi:hypothetical protein
MVKSCSHLGTIQPVTPSAKGCEECLKADGWWVHLRICRTCGHVGCCDDSPSKHANWARSRASSESDPPPRYQASAKEHEFCCKVPRRLGGICIRMGGRTK